MRTTTAASGLRLGVPDSFARIYLEAPLKRWRAAHPHSDLKVKTGYSHEVIDDLESHQIDIGVVAAKRKPSELHTLKRFPDGLCVVVPPGLGGIGPKKLVGLQPMVLGEACFFGQATRQLFQNAGLIGRRMESVFSIETIFQCVSVGLGASVLPRSLMKQHPMRTAVEVHPHPHKRAFSYYKLCLSSRRQSLLIKEAVDAFRTAPARP